jgi:Xaa-Pro aminopeptidase
VKSDIKVLMQEKGIDCLIIMGKPQGNPSMLYFTGNIKLLESIVVIKKGEKPLLIHSPIDRDEAQKSGLTTADYNYFELHAIKAKNKQERNIAGLVKIIKKRKIKGTVAFYGTMELSRGYPLLKHLDTHVKEIEIFEEPATDIISIARATKDKKEIDSIKKAGTRTVAVMRGIKDFLQHLYIKRDTVVDNSGHHITIGEIKRIISQEMFNRGLSEEVDTICSLGKDSAVPHSYGNNQQILKAGETLIIDIFPRSRESGYFFDMSRTFCLGFLPDEVKDIYGDVLDALKSVEKNLKIHTTADSYHHQVCQLFESRGYKTILNHPESEEGFVHSLGHGIGLDLHERPFFPSADPAEKLLPGMVFTLEPGLYFPKKGLGIRIEDVYYMDDDGNIENLTNFSRDIFIPLNKYS